MKFLFSLLIALLTVKDCKHKKPNNQQEVNSIEYTAMSRGFYKEVVVNNETISIKSDINSEPIVRSCTKEFWNDVRQIISNIDVKSMNSLEAPTQKRMHDGAAHANLKITIGGKTYETQGFDHGYPPKEIKSLCDSILETMVDSKKQNSIIGSYDVVFMEELQDIDISNKKLTINFNENGQVYGYNGCNNYKADCSIVEDRIEIGMMITTRRYCQDEFEVDGKLLRFLREGDNYKLTEDMLLLYKGNINTIKAKRKTNKK